MIFNNVHGCTDSKVLSVSVIKSEITVWPDSFNASLESAKLVSCQAVLHYI